MDFFMTCFRRWLAKTILKPCALALAGFAGLSLPAQADVALWSLTSASGGRALLMGTVHLLPDDAKWQSKAIKQAVAQSDVLVLEAILTGENAAKARAFAIERGFADSPQNSLAALLEEADIARLRAAEQRLQVPAALYDGMKPWFAALNISIAYAMHHGFEADAGAEQWLRGHFEADGRAIGPLESPSAGLEALASMDMPTQIEMLRGALAQVEQGGDAISGLFAAWKSGDLAGLEALLMAPEQFHEDVHAAVLVQRNANWVRPVLDYLKTPEEELIAVGAAHMIGPGNLLDLLADAGVRVERLK